MRPSLWHAIAHGAGGHAAVGRDRDEQAGLVGVGHPGAVRVGDAHLQDATVAIDVLDRQAGPSMPVAVRPRTHARPSELRHVRQHPFRTVRVDARNDVERPAAHGSGDLFVAGDEAVDQMVQDVARGDGGGELLGVDAGVDPVRGLGVVRAVGGVRDGDEQEFTAFVGPAVRLHGDEVRVVRAELVEPCRQLVVPQEPVELVRDCHGRTLERRSSIASMTGTLVILRHGQSVWNLANLFTGWHDVELTELGIAEASAAGRTMRDEGLQFDTSHTSLQTRAVVTQHYALAEMDQSWLPVERSWRLNERHYGALQGLDKKETTAKYGAEQVHAWRRRYAIPPPPVDVDSPEHPINDPRYRHLPPDVLPAVGVPARRRRPRAAVLVRPRRPAAPGRRDRADHRARQLAAGAAQAPRRGERRRHRRREHPDGRAASVSIRRAASRCTSAGYLGDAEAVAAAAEAVARQAGTA